jgi:ribonuclease R
MLQGKVISKGIFLSIDTYPSTKCRFYKNQLYFQLLPDDIILYSVENDLVTVHKILFRKERYTIGILHNYNESSGIYIFHTPLLTRNFICYIHSQYVNSEEKCKVGSRYIVRIGKLFNSIIGFYGNVSERNRDHIILNDLYTESWRFTLPYYPLHFSKEEGSKGYYTHNGEECVDLTHLYTFNIDPTSSKDFDDAISVDVSTKKIYIHIVDANQIYPMSGVEKRMAYLGLTFYNHIQNCNILPNHLSEDQFSLVVGKKRRVITVEITIDNNIEVSDGKLPIVSYQIYKSIIVVKERFDYENVLSAELHPFEFLQNLTQKYYHRRINITQPTYCVHRDNGRLEKIVYEDMNSWSHKLIEMMMINANRIVTEHMNSFETKIPQRIHPKPFQEVEHVTGDELIDGIIMIQKYKSASYHHEKSGHYGLNLDYYTHFTSPIRRYHDVIVMRMIDGYVYEKVDELLCHINVREQLCSDFEKIYKEWKLLDYLSRNSEEVYEAYVINNTPHGIKFYIKSLGYDGFLRGVYPQNIGEKIRLFCSGVCYTSFENVSWILV